MRPIGGSAARRSSGESLCCCTSALSSAWLPIACARARWGHLLVDDERLLNGLSIVYLVEIKQAHICGRLCYWSIVQGPEPCAYSMFSCLSPNRRLTASSGVSAHTGTLLSRTFTAQLYAIPSRPRHQQNVTVERLRGLCSVRLRVPRRGTHETARMNSEPPRPRVHQNKKLLEWCINETGDGWLDS